MLETVTVEWIMSHGPCGNYPEERVWELVGAGMSRPDFLRLPIPAADRVWVATRPGFLTPAERRAWLDVVVERAIRRSLGRSGSPEWESWAAAWLSGEDRTAAAADAAARAARAGAALAARSAAWAGAAAWAALAAAARAVERETQVRDLLAIIAR